jgi:hypothetical protein
VNAPHVQVSVVMPGHIGTDIVHNSRGAGGPSPTSPTCAPGSPGAASPPTGWTTRRCAR